MRKVRWNTVHEQGDIDELFEAVGDDFAIALDRNGWQITMKPECRMEDRPEECKWPMQEPTDACPKWAGAPLGVPERELDTRLTRHLRIVPTKTKRRGYHKPRTERKYHERCSRCR